MTDLHNDSDVDNDPNGSAEEAPGKAAFERWYASMANVPIEEVSADAWAGLGEHKATWIAIAEAAITAYEDPDNLGPIARDMEPEELERFRGSSSTNSAQ